MSFARSWSIAAMGLGVALALALPGCEGEEQEAGIEEPLLLSPAVFKKGKLPGTPGDGQPAQGPSVSWSISGRLQQGASSLTLAGEASAETRGVGIRFADEGSGYWLATVGNENLFKPGTYDWGGRLDLGFELVPGPHDLIAVGFDIHGKPGKQTKQTICIERDIFDNGNTCTPTIAPPAAVAVLRWNVNADVDLSVLSPDRVTYDRNNQFRLADKKITAQLLGDGSAVCRQEGPRSETFVWHEPPGAGIWYLYANLFDGCSQASVSYELTVYRRKDNGDGTYALLEEKTFAGAFVRSQVQTETIQPLYLTTVRF